MWEQDQQILASMNGSRSAKENRICSLSHDCRCRRGGVGYTTRIRDNRGVWQCESVDNRHNCKTQIQLESNYAWKNDSTTSIWRTPCNCTHCTALESFCAFFTSLSNERYCLRTPTGSPARKIFKFARSKET